MGSQVTPGDTGRGASGWHYQAERSALYTSF